LIDDKHDSEIKEIDVDSMAKATSGISVGGLQRHRDKEVKRAYEQCVNNLAMTKKMTSKDQQDTPLGQKIISSGAFLSTVYLAIFVNAIQLGVQIDHPQHEDVYYVLDLSCNSIFLGELLIKLAVLRIEYFKNGWNVFDFGLVIQSLVDFVWEGSSGAKQLTVLRILRMMRVVRVIRLLKVFRELWLIIQGLIKSFVPILWVVLLLLLIIYMSSIFVTMSFQGVMEQYPGYLPREKIDEWQNIDSFNPEQHFGSVIQSMFSLFNLLILAEWAEFAWAISVKQPGLLVFFIFFILLTTFGIMNILISIIVENTMEASDKLKKDVEMLDTTRKIKILDQLRKILEAVDPDSEGITESELTEAMRNPDFCEMLDSVGFPESFSAGELFDLLNTSGQEELTVDEFLRSSLRLVGCERSVFQFNSMALAVNNKILNELRHARASLESNAGMQQSNAGLSARMLEEITALRSEVAALRIDSMADKASLRKEIEQMRSKSWTVACGTSSPKA
jgi:voltage-gated sodium channel